MWENVKSPNNGKPGERTDTSGAQDLKRKGKIFYGGKKKIEAQGRDKKVVKVKRNSNCEGEERMGRTIPKKEW